MVATFSQQFRTILKKNIIIHLRSRALFRELLNLAIVIAVVIVIDKTGNQASSKQQIPFYMSIAIMLFCRGVALNWVGERQSRQSEVQKIMGISNAAYYSGWMVFSLLNGIFISTVFIGILASTGFFSGTSTSFGQIFGLYFLYLVASFSFVLFLCSFFSDALFASQIITFIQLLSSMLYFLLYVSSFRQSQIAMQITAIFPSICFQFTIMSMGLGDNGPLFQTPFTVTQGFITLGSVTAGYFILFIYFSLVLPNENGNNLHPLFFLDCCKTQKPQTQLQKSFQLANMSSARYYEETKDEKKISLYLKNLTKTFDQKVIVDKLSLSLFEGQIFCLLGHNGAGKTTTINMLTGIIQPDSGIINICGYDYYSQMNLIRNKTGVCLQIDVLYDELTVKQQLQFFANIKGIPAERMEKTVNDIIDKCGLVDQQQKRTKQLSGGNKRKTCLACASIGDSQLLFLDQPSSGLDPNSRRVIWSLIESLRKQGRTLILTTHHLEQAQALANRIGILAHGQMLVQGSCHYIKEKFGCGYYLEITLNQQKDLTAQKASLRSKVKDLIAGFRQDLQVSDNSMRFLLPNNQQEYYTALFAFLEEQKYRFSLKLSSLEDIFIKIGIDAESILTNEPLPELEKITIPEYKPVYKMSTQISHIFFKKLKTTIRSPSVFFSIILPIIFIVIGIAITLEAFPIVADNEQTTIINTWSKYYTWSFFMCLAFAFNTASYCGSLVKQRQISFSYLSYVMGMKKSAYWLGTILFDLLQFCLPFSIIFLVIGCFPSDQNADFVASFGWLALTLVLFSFSFLPFTYLWSFAFQKASSAYRFYPFLVYIGFYVLPEIPMFIWPNTPEVQYILPLVSPLLSLNACMMSKQMLGAQNYHLISVLSANYNIQFFTQSEIWYPLVILLAQSIIFFTLVLIIDNLKFNLNDRMDLNQHEKRLTQSEDLIKQKAIIRQLKSTQPVVVDSLYKKYSNGYIAVRDNSFTVQSGETFGLLGPNGAGKSTTFNILTAAIPKTSGKVMLHGNEVNRAVDEIFTTVGVCPQFNPLYDELTTAQHIDFFAGIKGLNGVQKQQIIDFYMTNLQLTQYKDVRSKKLSGGNKRKLCVAMSLIGNPSLVFLDQPSAGVDPIARRFLWNVLHSSSSLKDKSIVLTTHSINEAQSLCTRIGILIKGQFYCIGSPRQLKQRYGKGYRATVRCDSFSNIEVTRKLVRQNFSNFTEQLFSQQIKICFEFSKQDFIFSKAFSLFYNKLLQERLILQFEISETTLEEVFIYLSRMQIEQEIEPIEQRSSNFCCWERNNNGCFCIC